MTSHKDATTIQIDVVKGHTDTMIVHTAPVAAHAEAAMSHVVSAPPTQRLWQPMQRLQ